MNSGNYVDPWFPSPYATMPLMSRRVPIALLVAVAVANFFASGVGAQAPCRNGVPCWFGTWQQELPAASWFESPAFKRVTLRIVPWQDGLRVIYDMVRTRGGVAHREWSGRFDGRDYPVQGVDNFLTNAYRRIDDRRYEIVIKVDGQEAATALASVSPDGAVLTVITTQKDAAGQTVRSTAVYRRVG